VKLHALLAKCLLVVLLLGAYLTFSEVETISKSTATTVLLADAPGTVYAQPAALFSATQQLQTVVELLGQFPHLKQHTQFSLLSGANAEHHLSFVVRNFIRTDAYRVAAFGRTAIISPFHHFF